jgi:hypothetical protein
MDMGRRRVRGPGGRLVVGALMGWSEVSHGYAIQAASELSGRHPGAVRPPERDGFANPEHAGGTRATSGRTWSASGPSRRSLARGSISIVRLETAVGRSPGAGR